MTIPVERRRALASAGEFLMNLLDPKKYPRVPKAVRQHARMVVKHYPLSTTFDFYYKEKKP